MLMLIIGIVPFVDSLLFIIEKQRRKKDHGYSSGFYRKMRDTLFKSRYSAEITFVVSALCIIMGILSMVMK